MTIDREEIPDALDTRCLGHPGILRTVARTMAEQLPITLTGLRTTLERHDP